MQLALYDKGKGGFVLHGITGKFKGKLSGYYDSTGKLLDAEQILNHNSRPVKKDGPLWSLLESNGRVSLGLVKQKMEKEAAQ